MKLFTYMDHLNGTCKAHEIDQPWEPRWTSSDVSLGLCDDEMVGTPKPLNADSEIAAAVDQMEALDDPTILRICRDRGIDPHDAEGKARIMLEIAPVEFARKMPTMYMDMVKQQRIEKATQSAEAATLAKLSATRLRGMDDQDILLAFVNGILAEAEDVRERILKRMDIDITGLKEMILEGEADHI